MRTCRRTKPVTYVPDWILADMAPAKMNKENENDEER